MPHPTKLCYNIEDFSDEDFGNFIDFVEWDEDDSNRLCRVFILNRDGKFQDAEIIALMEDELQIKCRGTGEKREWNEALGMEFKHSVEGDWEMSILKKDIAGVSVTRRINCGCPSCQSAREKNEAFQPEGYELDIVVAGREVSVVIHNKDAAFGIKQTIQYWLRQPIEMPKKKKKKDGNWST